MKTLATSIVFLLCAFSSATRAGNWVMDPAQSHLTFSATQAALPFEGHFKTFSAEIRYDPAIPDTASLSVQIDLTSVSAGSSERDAALPSAEWFDTDRHPQALFTSTGFEKKDNGTFQTHGILALKGVEKPLTLSFTLDIKGTEARAKGKARLNRQAFRVGTGFFEGEDVAGHMVDLAFDIRATRLP